MTISQTPRIHTISDYLKDRFSQKVIKLSLDGGFTCPNRDGSKGVGGCIFCSDKGSGDFASDIKGQIALLSNKWPNAKHIVYFQSHTNTYANVNILREKFYEALESDPENIVGIAIATRPDCLNDEIYALLDELNKKTFLWVELGLQTMHEKTADLINRCYPLCEYEKAIKKLSSLGILIVTHLIFGLPGETRSQMLESVKYACQPIGSNATHIFGIKLHLLNVIRGSQMEVMYPDYVPFSSMDEYIDLICDALELIPYDITVHRMTADAPRNILISPEWSYQKRSILNGIQKRLVERDTHQGAKVKS